ncbi:MAG: hypothetical protein ACKESB_00220 [Candidatus Hodgkinia cicadicola]
MSCAKVNIVFTDCSANCGPHLVRLTNQISIALAYNKLRVCGWCRRSVLTSRCRLRSGWWKTREKRGREEGWKKEGKGGKGEKSPTSNENRNTSASPAEAFN